MYNCRLRKGVWQFPTFPCHLVSLDRTRFNTEIAVSFFRIALCCDCLTSGRRTTLQVERPGFNSRQGTTSRSVWGPPCPVPISKNSMCTSSFLQCILHIFHSLYQRCPTGGPQATLGPRLLVNRQAKLFVNLLLVATSSFISFSPNDLKKNLDSYLVCCFTYKCHTC
jgi:hypothetical protein